MTGMVIPIQIEGGRSPAAKSVQQRNGGEAAIRKPLRKKNSRQKCRTFNIEIELEGFTGKESAERKNGISCQQGQSKMSVSVPLQPLVSSKKLPRRSSSKDLRGVIRRQSSKDLRTGGMMRRQSSRDMVGGGGGSRKVTHPSHPNQTEHKDPKLSRMISGQSIGDVCLPSLDERFTIRRDSINGLRIVSKLDQSQTEALTRLADIALNSAEESEVEFSKFQTEALATHNKYRARHGVTALALDTELCARAQQYADTLASTDTFEHSGEPDLGENLYWSWSSDPAWRCGGEEPVTSWYDECRGYRYEVEPRETDTGHFTQLVWSASRNLGVGVSQSAKTGRFYVVMKYDPPGNVIGSYTRHVNRPRH